MPGEFPRTLTMGFCGHEARPTLFDKMWIAGCNACARQTSCSTFSLASDLGYSMKYQPVPGSLFLALESQRFVLLLLPSGAQNAK